MLRKQEGEHVDPDELSALVRNGIVDAVRRQVDAGVDIVNDGEFGKPSYVTYVQDRMNGFGGESAPLVIADFDDHPDAAAGLLTDPGFQHMARPACVDAISRRPEADAAVASDIAALREALAGTTATEGFLTAVSPATISMFLENKYYPDRESYLRALADAMRPEYKAIVDAGFILQIDCPDLGCGHVIYPNIDRAELKRRLALHVEVLNDAIADLPADRMRMHMCWGNYDGPHHKDIELKEVIDIVLRARPNGLVLEAANPRHAHEWQVFADVTLPDGKVLMPGVVDSTNNYIEHPELIAQRIVQYARLVGRENVLAATDCGFGTLVGLRNTAASVAWAKLESMAQGAALATQRLWK